MAFKLQWAVIFSSFRRAAGQAELDSEPEGASENNGTSGASAPLNVAFRVASHAGTRENNIPPGRTPGLSLALAPSRDPDSLSGRVHIHWHLQVQLEVDTPRPLDRSSCGVKYDLEIGANPLSSKFLSW